MTFERASAELPTPDAPERVGIVRAITKISLNSHIPAMRIAIVEVGEVSLKVAVSYDIRCQTEAAVRVLRSKDFLITRDRIVSGPCALKGVTQS